MIVLETERLVLRHAAESDDGFMFGLMNEPSWIRNIGDRGIRTTGDARAYLRRSYIAGYERLGFGMYMVEERASGNLVGVCGLLKRDGIDDVEVGFAFMPVSWGRGFATEAASASLAYGLGPQALDRVVAITRPDNHASIRVLERIGMHYERRVRPVPDEAELMLFVRESES